MKKISRRDFLKVTGLVGAAAALTACGGSASSTAASTASSAAGSAAASTAALGADTQAIVDRGVLKVGVKNAVQGFSFQDTLTGEYKGLEDSLAEMIAEHLGVDVEFTTVTAATRGELLDSGDIDAVLATFTITEERKKTWDFSTPYYTDYVSVLVEDSTGIKGLADLKDKVVGVSSGSTSARALVKAMIDEGVLDGANFDADTFNADTWKDGISFRQYDDYPAISTALSAGEVQGFCVDKSILAIYKTEGRSYIDAEFSPQEYGVATKKGSDVTAALKEQVESCGVEFVLLSDAEPLYLPKESQLVTLLSGAYKDVTGEECDIFSMGGGTYARQMFGKGVAFGASFKDQADSRAHQANEFLDLRRFKLHAEICLEAMYRMLTAE